jgi:xyloglucan-specific endo-beta-1,4-glucanase
MKLALLTLISTAALATAAPAVLVQNLDVFCDKNGLQPLGDYTVYNNLWGQDRGSGSQCTGIDSVEGNTVKWHTKWSWSGRYPSLVLIL